MYEYEYDTTPNVPTNALLIVLNWLKVPSVESGTWPVVEYVDKKDKCLPEAKPKIDGNDRLPTKRRQNPKNPQKSWKYRAKCIFHRSWEIDGEMVVHELRSHTDSEAAVGRQIVRVGVRNY